LCHSHRHNPVTERVYEPPNGFRGICQVGEGFEATACNNKLIGARYYLDGFLFTSQLDENEFRSPRDADGHGTHIATTVAGNPVSARLFGTRVGRIAGIAPRARVAIYKACWLKPGEVRATCATSDLARAIDDAVADGVDIINYSIGSIEETDLTAPDDLALLNALDAGVLSIVAAGNDGPSLDTIGSPSSAPWVLTVAASTHTGNLFADAIEITAPEDLAEKIPALEANFTPQLAEVGPIEGSLVLVDDDQEALGDGSAGTTRDACQTLVNDDEIDGGIALIEEGGCIFEDKLARAEAAGAIAVIVYARAGETLVVMTGDEGSVDIPAVMIETADGQRLADRLTGDGDDVQLTLDKGVFLERRQEGNQMASFSSRGPPLSDQNFLKPDVTAPGVNILAGHTPAVANGLRGETFQYLSGTSHAAPEVAGIAALLKEAHPEWSPGALKSALMTTAYKGVYTEKDLLANPFDMGAGHIDPNLAVNPGLVYDSDFRDHAAYLCGYFEAPFSASECDALAAAGFSSDARNVNLPSIAVADLITGDVIKRRVTNVGPPATFTAEVRPPIDVDVVVEPATLSLSTGQTAEFTVRFDDRGSPLDLWDFGELGWSDGTRAVVSPIAVQPVTLRAPRELMLSGTGGNVTVPIAFGYSGPYLADVNGLWPPFVSDTGQVPRGFVDDDPTNTFTTRTGAGVTGHRLDVADGQLYLRVALFDEFTDGEDDLDLFLFYCAASVDNCTQIAQSGGFTSDEEINVLFPDPGIYIALVHGFETDQVAGGPGANYSLFTWSFGEGDPAGNMSVVAPATVTAGDRTQLALTWAGLTSGLRHLGAIAHTTPGGLYSLTIVNVNAP
jgi:subtilisin family serine protease